MDRQAGDLAGEVVQGGIDGALRPTVPPIAAWSRPLADRTPSAVGSKPSIEARRNGKIAAMVSTVSP